MERLKVALRLVLNGTSIAAASRSAHVHRNTLAKYLAANPDLTSTTVKNVEELPDGRPPYLSEASLETLKIYALTLDFNGYPISRQTLTNAVWNLKKTECKNLEVDPPSPPTLRKIIKSQGIPVHTLRKGVSVDACRKSKATERYLGDYFEKLREVIQQYQIPASNIFNTDEVGVQMTNFNLQFLTTRPNLRGNLSHEHVTVLITTGATGQLLPSYLLFPGKDTSAIPNVVDQHKDTCWGNFSEAGWMDVERFQVYSLKLLDELRRKSGIVDSTLPLDEYHLLLVDGHNSRMNESTLFNCARNRLIIFCGPSNLTNAWQANDAGVNKTFKENLKKVISNHIEAHLEFSPSDMVVYILRALSQNNMKRSITNSFRHVGIEPFDPDRMYAMMRQEKPNELLLEQNPVLQVAVSMAKDHLDHLDGVCHEKRKRDDEEKEKRARRRMTLDTSFAVVLTDPGSIATIQMSTTMSDIMRKKAGELQNEMLALGWCEDELKKPGGSGFRNKKELQEMVRQRLLQSKSAQEEKIREEIEKRLIHPPSLSLVSVPLQAETSSSAEMERNEEDEVTEGEENEMGDIFAMISEGEEVDFSEDEWGEVYEENGENGDFDERDKIVSQNTFQIGELTEETHATLCADFKEIESEALRDIHAPRQQRLRRRSAMREWFEG